MLRLSNIRIGIKLAIMSGLGVLLVAAMIATQMLGQCRGPRRERRRPFAGPILCKILGCQGVDARHASRRARYSSRTLCRGS